jgi:hypothetical protein
MKTFREIAEMHYIAEANNEADKQYRLNRIDALEKLLTEECEEKMKEILSNFFGWTDTMLTKDDMRSMTNDEIAELYLTNKTN